MDTRTAAPLFTHGSSDQAAKIPILLDIKDKAVRAHKRGIIPEEDWAKLAPYLPPAELPDDDFPLTLTTGRLPHQWHTMTKTRKVAKLMKLNPSTFIEINPVDAENLGITDGDRVEIRDFGVFALHAREARTPPVRTNAANVRRRPRGHGALPCCVTYRPRSASRLRPPAIDPFTHHRS